MDLIFIIVGFFLLILGGNWLLKSAIGFSLRLQIPKIVVGMTVVSFATSAPELIVSLKAALQGHPDLALSNAIGSNIANLGLVLGVTVMLSTIKLSDSFYKTDIPILFLSSTLLYLFLIFDGVLQSYEGGILFLLLLVFLIYLLKYQTPAVHDEMPEDDEELPLYQGLLFFVLGAVGLWGGSELLIDGAVGLAKQFHVSERIIGITIVSIGTSIPELSASIIAVLKKEKAISIGNLIGSNVFNILAVLGLTALVSPIQVSDLDLIQNDIYWMLAVTVLIVPLSYWLPNMQFAKKEGVLLLFFYACFMYQLLQ